MANTRTLGCLSIFLFLALAASVLVNLMLAAASFGRFESGRVEVENRPRFNEVILERGGRGSSNKIAVISLRGLISTGVPGNLGESMVDDLCWQLEQARKDDEVRGVVLVIDSPGGEVTASDIIYNAVAKTRAVKPVVVYMESVAASGGYYVSCGGQYLIANDTSITGSIGVIIQTLNYQQLFDKIGLAAVIFKSGKFKDMLNGARPITPEERDYIQSFVMNTYEKFLGIVARERHLSADVLRNGIADGRILSGRDALQYKLIDGLGQVEDAYAKAKELGHAPAARVVKYAPPLSLGRFLRLFVKGGDTKIELSLPGQLSPQLQSGHAYFLPSFYAP